MEGRQGTTEYKERWIAEQARIAQAVIDTDDASWSLHPAETDRPATPSELVAVKVAGVEFTTTNTTTDTGLEPGAGGGGREGKGGGGCVSPPPHRRLRLVGGVDISFVKGSDENACATLVVLDFPGLNVVYEAFERVTMEYPYVSGFLAFREVDHLARLVDKLRRERPDLEPDVVFVDGNGQLHPRGAGLACHLGVVAGLRTVGLGKTFLHVDGLTKGSVRERVWALLATGERELPLVGASGRVWGVALVPKEEGKGAAVVTNPVFVSIGHRVSLETCVALTKAVGRYRVPEPIRQADMRSREVIRAWMQEKEDCHQRRPQKQQQQQQQQQL